MSAATRILLTLCCSVPILAAASAASFSAGSPANLIQNPGAETLTSSGAPANWILDGGFTAEAYGRDVPPAESVRIGGGANHFYGGSGTTLSHARQTVDVSKSAAAIDAGRARATLNGFMGSYEGQADGGPISATFRAADGSGLGVLTIGPVRPAERANLTKLLARSATRAVPVKTRSVEVTMTSTRTFGGDNDGYFDNLSLTLSTDQETTTTIQQQKVAPPRPTNRYVGLWMRTDRTDPAFFRWTFRWVTIPGVGLEEQNDLQGRLRTGCLVEAREPVNRYLGTGSRDSGLYRVSHRVWKPGAGGPGADGRNCTTSWNSSAETVKLSSTGAKLTVSCPNTPLKVCATYVRVGG